MEKIAVILTDQHRKIQWVNDDFTEITGYNFSDVLGKSPSLLQGKDTDPAAVSRIRKSLSMMQSFTEEILNYRKNGEPYVCKLTIHPIFNKHKELTNYIAFEVDGDVVDDLSKVPLLRIKERYRTSSLKGMDAAKLFYRLQSSLEREKGYLNPQLTLGDLAEELGTNTKYLSQVINFYAGTNLQQFLNRFRIEEVKEQLGNPENSNLTLFGVAMRCGFKNKSTFYKVFKQFTNKTPADFMKEQETTKSN